MSSPSEFPQLGRYQVIDRIAAGGMAEVFLARSVGAMGFERLVAVKLIHANFTRDPEFVKMFIDEARIAMHLHHRNIVQVFDLDEVAGTYFLAMEYVRGVNLYNLYERIAAENRWIEIPMALYVVAEVCKGLHFAHTRIGMDGRPMGIIHRDISPQNVLLSFEGEVKITDFGIATAAERLHQTAAGIVKGKYAYMAPERLQEAPSDARVDVFSAGVLLYELLVGENPFAGPSAVETIEAVLAGNVPAPSDKGAPVSKRLDEICMTALAPDPAHRFATAADLADELTELAMEATYTRKNMAAGDLGVARLLGELFSEERARPADYMAATTLGPMPGMGGGRQEAPARPGRSSRAAVVPMDIEGEEGEAPTVLRSSPMNEESSFDRTMEASPDALPPWSLSRPFEPRPKPPKDATTDLRESAGFDPTIQVAPVSPGSLANETDEDPYAQTLPAGVDETEQMEPARPESGEQPTAVREDSPDAWAAPPDPAERASEATTRAPQPLPLEHEDSGPHPLAPRSRRKPWALLGLAVAAGASAVGGAALLWETGAPRVVEVPLILASTPAGARVTVDNRPLPDPTPTQTSVLAGEEIEVRFALEGFEEVVRRIVPSERRAAELTASLKPHPSKRLEASPRARIVTLRPRSGRRGLLFRDGKRLGPTPLTLELPVGTLHLEFKRKGRRRRTPLEVEIPPTGDKEIILDL